MKRHLHEQKFVQVGFIRKSHGYKGAVKVVCDDIFVDDLMDSKFVFLQIRGLKVPYKVLNIIDEGDIIVHFDTVDSSEEAANIIGSEMFLLEKDLTYAKEFLDNQNQKGWSGYSIVDAISQKSMIIDRVEEFPQQLMAVVIDGKEEKYIPLNDEFIKRIDEPSQLIEMELPEGLLDL